MKKITILHCSETLAVSGCCRVMEHLAKGVDASRFTSMFCAETANADYLEYLHRENIKPLLLTRALPEIPKPFIAVLHRSGNNAPFWQRLIPQLREAGVSAIIERNIFGYTDALYDRHLDHICANSLNTLWHHWRQSGKPEIAHYLSRHRVLYNAVSFAPTLEELTTLRNEWRKKLHIPDDAFVLGIVTRPDPQKIDALIIGLIPQLKKTIPNFTLVTRRYPPTLARILKQMLGDRYHNLPVSSEPDALKATYALMDVCGNFPSIGESFGMAMAEAMRAYRPVVALDLPFANKGNSQRELIDNGTNGYLASSPVEIAVALEKLAASSTLRARMGAAAHRKMSTAPFSLESVIAQFEAEVLHHLGESVATPMLPDAETIRHYLETYPQKLENVLMIADQKNSNLPVTTTRLLWRIARRFA